MQRNLLILCVVVFLIGAVIALNIRAVESQGDMVQRGKYLVDAVAACGYCHTPRVGADYDMNMYLAGHPAGQPSPRYNFRMIREGIFIVTAPQLSAFSGAFGTSFASNLTPDKETGLGEWTEEMFIKAMRTGRHQGVESNRKILPPMPVKHYAQMNDEDLKAIWAYLRTIKPVKNEVNPALDHQGNPQ